MSLILMVPVPGHAGPTDSSFWRVDKKEHFIVTGAVTGATYLLLRNMSYNRWESLVTSMAVGVLIGTAKEVYDRSVDSDDIKADALGAAAVGGVFFTVDLIAF